MGRAAAVRLMIVVCAATCAACANDAASELRGRWKPVNRFADAVREIPLRRPYLFQASPMDGTLKSMLERWSVDSNTSLRYLHPSDFTLHTAVAGLRTSNLDEAAATLSRAYAGHGVVISVGEGQILVRPLPDTPAEAPPAVPEDAPTP